MDRNMVTKYEQSNSDVIGDLISSLEAKLIKFEKMTQMKRHLMNIETTNTYINYSNSGDYNYNHTLNSELLQIVEDHNDIIHQSVQAMRSLQYENLNLKEGINYEKKMMLSQSLNNNKESDLHLYERYLSTEEMQMSQKDNLFKLNYDYSESKKESDWKNMQINNVNNMKNLNLNNIHNNNTNQIIAVQKNEEFSLHNAIEEKEIFLKNKIRNRISLRERIKSPMASNNINQVRKTNEILKFLNETHTYSNYFASRYANGSYKDFLEKLISYSTDMETLDGVLHDIALFQEQPGHFSHTEESFTNFIKNSTNREHPNNENSENCEKSSTATNFRRNNNLLLQEKSLNNFNNNNIYIKNNSSNVTPKNRSTNNTPNNKLHTNSNANFNMNDGDGFINFEKLLRNYDNNQMNVVGKKPFNRFTRLHGNYFDRKLTAYSNKISPSGSRSKSR